MKLIQNGHHPLSGWAAPVMAPIAVLSLLIAPEAVAQTFGASATGYGYVTFQVGSTVEAETTQLYSVGGAGFTLAEGNGTYGANYGPGGPEYSYANLATGTVFAAGSYATAASSATGMNAGPTMGNAEIYDTVTFSNVPPGAMGTLVLYTPSFEVDGLAQIYESISFGSAADGVGAGITQTLNASGDTLAVTSSSGPGNCTCTQTTSAGWTSLVSVMFPLVAGTTYTLVDQANAQTFEPNPIPLYPGSTSYGDAEIDPSWGLILPAGVTYTTASGVTINTSPVPVPSPLMLMAAGLAFLTLMRRRPSRLSGASALSRRMGDGHKFGAPGQSCIGPVTG